MLKTLSRAALVFTLAVPSMCQAQTYQKTATGARASVNGADIELTFYNPEIVRVVKTPVGHTFSKESLSVIKKPEQTQFTSKQQDNVLNLQSARLIISLNLKSGELAFATASGKALLKEKTDGVAFSPFDDAGNKTYTVSQAFTLDKDEPIYGLGQHQRGNLNQRGQRYNNMVQGNTDDVVPVFQSVKGYGVFWDNYSPTTFDDDQNATSFKSEVGDGVDYYFMYGSNADGVIAAMRHLTGQAPLFPLWTFGYWQSKERYKSQDELVSVVKRYRDLKVPIDGIIQDWHADADFTLYEDENDNYNYEKGKFSQINFHWDDKKHLLKIAERTGSFDGMLVQRKFNVVICADRS